MASCSASTTSSHHQPAATASSETSPTTAWFVRGARESITCRSVYGLALRRIDHHAGAHRVVRRLVDQDERPGRAVARVRIDGDGLGKAEADETEVVQLEPSRGPPVPERGDLHHRLDLAHAR